MSAEVMSCEATYIAEVVNPVEDVDIIGHD